MDALLRWSIENSTRSEDAPAGAEPTVPRQPIDPAVIDLILGKPDSEVMKENLAVAVDESKGMGERVLALDNFEMTMRIVSDLPGTVLVPPTVNSRSRIEKTWRHSRCGSPYNPFKLTPRPDPIARIMDLGNSHSEQSQAQEIYLSYKPLSGVLEILSSPDSDASPETRSKAVYCISNAVRHSAQAVHQLGSLGGWKVLNGALTGTSPDTVAVRRKTAFLLNTLLLQDGSSPEEEADPIKLPHPYTPTFRRTFPPPHKQQQMLESSSPSPTLNGQHGLNEEQRGLLAQLLKSTGKESGLVRWNLVEEEWATLEASL
ncbi:hypothetical protein BS47DRAFT_1393848 [Hydnum rufescens UP504]|uniref:Nucleotide exchange factor Fes1 domain-containing protein n=1 Tax=Hydnum rufescens UP504 TaxID=1448309 RepID=A0A9P6AWT8_9AGAM|nr:hypothetical protein BS47DRAFT_1393848 [Hydnum rufescens UP504]